MECSECGSNNHNTLNCSRLNLTSRDKNMVLTLYQDYSKKPVIHQEPGCVTCEYETQGWSTEPCLECLRNKVRDLGSYTKHKSKKLPRRCDICPKGSWIYATKTVGEVDYCTVHYKEAIRNILEGLALKILEKRNQNEHSTVKNESIHNEK